MKLIVGLGNPGEKYKGTRHNIGFLTLDELKTKIINYHVSISNQNLNLNFQINKRLKSEVVKIDNIILAKPITFMNDSGLAVSSLTSYYKIHTDDIYIVHDDLDIRLGDYKFQKGKGPREHNGLLSIYEKLGTSDFWHVRIGVDNRKSHNRVPGEDYVLQKFSDGEMNLVNEVIDEATQELLGLIT
jgi:peptidyl-tRNA hydrolase, PTH1 family